MVMKNTLKNLVFTLALLLLGLPAWAAGPANVYKVRIAKMELWNGSAWVTVFEGTSTAIDIASVNSGALAGQFLSGISVPDGTYTQCRVTASQIFNIKGNDGSGRYTTATIGGNGGCVYSAVAANEAECAITITSTITPQTTTFSSPITAASGVFSHKIRVSFDVSASIEYNAGADEIFPAAPTTTVTAIKI